MNSTVLVRYGAIPEVSRFRTELPEGAERGAAVVIESSRGLELGTLLEAVPPVAENGSSGRQNGSKGHDTDLRLIRVAEAADIESHEAIRRECNSEFETWRSRITGWKLQLELIDLERTLDRSKLILYVLNERGPDCTKLALFSAAAGLGIVEVQPVTAEGLVRLETGGGGCGSGGGGCGCG
ncbi:MAG: PSP1 C-terminal domain-containing protein [Planctomycetaceae bacterium]